MAFDSFLIVRNPSGQTYRTETADSVFGRYNTLQVNSFSLGIRNNVSIGGSGAGTGKAAFDQLVINKGNSPNSPNFIQACAQGILIPRLTLLLRKSGGTPTSLTSITTIYSFGTVYVTSVEDQGSSGEDVPSESITFAFGEFAYHQYTTLNSGAAGPAYKSSWSQIKNTIWTGYTPMDGPITT